MPHSLADDPLLVGVPEVDGFKVLAPAVLHAKIGEGGMGAVYRGHHQVLRMDVAVKCLRPKHVGDSAQLEARFRREARISAELTHQNLVRLFEMRRAHGLSYLILEFVEGENARERVLRKGPLREEEAAKIVLGAARGLAVAHRHPDVIVHRDIKPANILISKRGVVKLADLGLAKAVESAGNTSFHTDGLIGTPQYMAPEQWDANERVTARTDVWALGATLYYLLTGHNAMRGATANQIYKEVVHDDFPDVRRERPDVSPELLAILERCTQKQPDARYADAAALAKDLHDFLRARAPAELASETLELGSRRRLLIRGAGAVALLAGVAVAWRGFGRPSLSAASNGVAPEGWKVLDPTAGSDGWALRVEHPQSKIVFRLVAPGTFVMGTAVQTELDDDDEAPHEVHISRPFYLAETETTQEQYRRLRGGDAVDSESHDLPMVLVDWLDARNFCDTLGGDLPTEAQWEFACRAGTTTRFWWGDVQEGGAGKGNFPDVTARTAYPHWLGTFPFEDGHVALAPVRSFKPNPWGFHDMLGNVSEWCRDAYRADYQKLARTDPCELVENRSDRPRVVRGGASTGTVAYCRCASRSPEPPSARAEHIGFRVVRELP